MKSWIRRGWDDFLFFLPTWVFSVILVVGVVVISMVFYAGSTTMDNYIQNQEGRGQEDSVVWKRSVIKQPEGCYVLYTVYHTTNPQTFMFKLDGCE